MTHALTIHFLIGVFVAGFLLWSVFVHEIHELEDGEKNWMVFALDTSEGDLQNLLVALLNFDTPRVGRMLDALEWAGKTCSFTDHTIPNSNAERYFRCVDAALGWALFECSAWRSGCDDTTTHILLKGNIFECSEWHSTCDDMTSYLIDTRGANLHLYKARAVDKDHRVHMPVFRLFIERGHLDIATPETLARAIRVPTNFETVCYLIETAHVPLDSSEVVLSFHETGTLAEHAMSTDSYDLIEYLQSKGLDFFNGDDQCRSLLERAVRKGDIHIVRKAHMLGCDLNADRYTLLSTAVGRWFVSYERDIEALARANPGRGFIVLDHVISYNVILSELLRHFDLEFPPMLYDVLPMQPIVSTNHPTMLLLRIKYVTAQTRVVTALEQEHGAYRPMIASGSGDLWEMYWFSKRRRVGPQPPSSVEGLVGDWADMQLALFDPRDPEFMRELLDEVGNAFKKQMCEAGHVCCNYWHPVCYMLVTR